MIHQYYYYYWLFVNGKGTENKWKRPGWPNLNNKSFCYMLPYRLQERSFTSSYRWPQPNKKACCTSISVTLINSLPVRDLFY